MLKCNCFVKINFFRWDSQRIREQRYNEKLKKKYNENNGYSKEDNIISLYPDPERALYIQVADWLPVDAFGGPLPNLPQE